MLFVSGLFVNIYFSTYLHLILSYRIKTFCIPQFDECIESIVSEQGHRMLFLCFQGLVLLIVILFYVSNNKSYQTELRVITPQIKTPVTAGQKQHGSAQWLLEKEKDIVFDNYSLKPRDKLIKFLIKNGLDDVQTVLTDYDTQKSPSEIKLTKNEVKKDKHMLRGGVAIGMNSQGNTEKIYYIGEDVHTLCIGATRSGKTRTAVLQTIGTLALAGESLILSDPKGELYQYTYPFLERLGYEVIVIDFKNPLKSNKYNFLQPVIDAVVADDISRAIDLTWDLTAVLVGEAKGERIWTDGEASIIASSIMSVVYDNKEKGNQRFQNLTNVYYFISQMCKTVGNSMPILEYVKRLDDKHPAKGLIGISEVAPSRTRGSFYTAALTTLRLFTNPMINAMTNSSDYDPKETGNKKRAIFFILPDEKSTYYSLASLFISQHYELLIKAADSRGGRLKNRVNFICEEFGNFVRINDFTNKLTVGGGRGIRFDLFLQSLAQLDEKYGKEAAKTIKSNCENWIYLQADDLDTLKEISEKLGNYTVSTYSLSASHAKYSTPSSSHSINLTNRSLLAVDEIRLISRPYSLVTSRNNPAIMYAPDLSQMYFNKMFGLGDLEHNRKVRESRENRRKQKDCMMKDIDLWNIWESYTNICEQKEQNNMPMTDVAHTNYKSQYTNNMRKEYQVFKGNDD